MTMPTPKGAKIVKLSQPENRRLRWLMKGTSGDVDRETLQCIHVKNGTSFATDGYRLLAAKTVPGLITAGLEYDMVRFDNVPASATVVEAEELSGVFPDIEAIVPKTEPNLQIMVSARMLRETLAGFTGDDDHVILRFWEPTRPFEVCGQVQGADAYALIMPIRMGDPEPEPWRPGPKPPEESQEPEDPEA